MKPSSALYKGPADQQPGESAGTTPVERLDAAWTTSADKAAALEDAFNREALALFEQQAENNPIYLRWIRGLRCRPDRIEHWTQIPALPISCFRQHLVHTPMTPSGRAQRGEAADGILFHSSGSTSSTASRHWIPEASSYRAAFLNGFRRFHGEAKDWAFLCLLPAYLEREGSSLVYMCAELIRRSRYPESGFFLHDHKALLASAAQLQEKGIPTMVFGAAFALLDLAETGPYNWKGLVVVETGGMKGRRKEPLRQDLHQALSHGFGVDRIAGEYGMTELCSQAWSQAAGLYRCPPWMRIRVRDLNDPFRIMPHGRVGAIDVVDLANTHSCAFIGTADLGMSHPDGSFEVLGRYDHAELRGCNLLVA